MDFPFFGPKLRNFGKVHMDLERKYKIFEEQSEVIPKALYCYPFCFLSTKTVCIINVWGCAEILPTFAIGTGDEEAIDEGATTGGDRTVGESFGFCCPGVEPEFFAESTNALLFSLISPMNIIALANIPSQSGGIISIKLPC